MKLKDFLDLYDNWNSTVVINSDELLPMFCHWQVSRFVDTYRYAPIMSRKVKAFGYYDNELCIRIDTK